MGMRRRSIFRRMAFSSRCAKDAMDTPGAVASASMRAISSAFLLEAWLATEALRVVCGGGGDALREVEGLERREARFVMGFSSILCEVGWEGRGGGGRTM